MFLGLMKNGLSGLESGTSLVLRYFARIQSVLILQCSERQFSAFPHDLRHENTVEFRFHCVQFLQIS